MIQSDNKKSSKTYGKALFKLVMWGCLLLSFIALDAIIKMGSISCPM